MPKAPGTGLSRAFLGRPRLRAGEMPTNRALRGQGLVVQELMSRFLYTSTRTASGTAVFMYTVTPSEPAFTTALSVVGFAVAAVACTAAGPATRTVTAIWK